MADNKGTHSPEPHTRTGQNFPEVKDKVVDTVELIIEADYCGIAIRFQDQTALTFAIEPCVFTFPALEDWTRGEGKVIKKYEPVQSAILR